MGAGLDRAGTFRNDNLDRVLDARCVMTPRGFAA